MQHESEANLAGRGIACFASASGNAVHTSWSHDAAVPARSITRGASPADARHAKRADEQHIVAITTTRVQGWPATALSILMAEPVRIPGEEQRQGSEESGP